MKEDSCGRAMTAIEELGDGDLGRVRWLLLRRHARRCGNCGSNLKRMEAVIDALSELTRVRAPDDLVEAVMACLMSGVSNAGARAEAERANRNIFIYAGAAALGVAVAVALGIVRWVVGRDRQEGLATIGSA